MNEVTEFQVTTEHRKEAPPATEGSGRGVHHWSSGFNSKYIRTLSNTHRQLGNESLGSPALFLLHKFKEREFAAKEKLSAGKASGFFNNLKLKNPLN